MASSRHVDFMAAILEFSENSKIAQNQLIRLNYAL